VNIAIFEDDWEFAKKLERVIQAHIDDIVVPGIMRKNELKGYLQQAAQPTLCFLDIMSDGIADGFALAEYINQCDCGHLVVFVTGYPSKIIGNPLYLTKAFSLILKNSLAFEDEVRATIELADNVMKKNSLLIHKGKFDSLYIPLDSIFFIESMKNSDKVCIYCKNGQFIIRSSLTGLLAKLDERFVRCHYSFVVNRQNIIKINKRERTVQFPDNSFCPYSYLKGGSLL
jgi:two-component system response regulator AgrA